MNILKNQPIQWHLNNTRHDTCPACGSDLGYITQGERTCLGAPSGGICGEDKVWVYSAGDCKDFPAAVQDLASGANNYIFKPRKCRTGEYDGKITSSPFAHFNDNRRTN